MLAGELPFFEGAVRVVNLMHCLNGIGDDDPDFRIFVLIQSETDHLPLEAQRPLWSASALEALEPEFLRTEEWAKCFAEQACKNLIARFTP
ncbi:DUF2489 domain-containing protein [Bordetella sp. H567]|uniref:DUF2489 domain-containing protein n=1 Tax=Bordetella sp. H567 TaxID=1697043 RepID=UPI001F44DC23|nr:DUF2489 domain-containing protein [Bordetella sp. H567]